MDNARSRAFTLIELIIVVIIISILVTMAIPQYRKATERAKEAKARSNALLIAKAEHMRHEDPDQAAGNRYTFEYGALVTIGVRCGAPNCGHIGQYIEMDRIIADDDFTYSVGARGADGFFVLARKARGLCSGFLLTFSDEGNWGGGYSDCVRDL